MRDGKDTLAVGNVTGAMAFQATIPVALGLLVTDWDLATEAVVAGAIALVGGALALYALPRNRLGAGPTIVWAALFVGFVAFAALG